MTAVKEKSESSSSHVHEVQKYEQEFYRRLWLHLGVVYFTIATYVFKDSARTEQ